MMARAHKHDQVVQRIGPGLERSVCSECGHVSIRPVPRTVAKSGHESPLPRLFTEHG